MDNNKIITSPDLSVPEHKKDAEWYKTNLRYFMTFYNRTPSNTGNPNPVDNLGYVDRGLVNMKYYEGQQQNINYNHAVTDINGNPLQAVWIPGKKVQSLINHRLGFLSRQFEQKDISAKSLSSEFIAYKQQLLEDSLLKFDQDFVNLENELAKYGVSYEPLGGKNFSNPEEVSKYIDQNIKDYGETIAVTLAKNIEHKSGSNIEYKKAFLSWHAAGVAGMYNYVQNGQVKQRALWFHELVWDNLKDNPIKKDMQFAGVVEKLTANELFSRYSFSDSERAEILELSRAAKNPRGNPLASEFMSTCNTPGMLNWDYTQGQLLISVVTMYFIADRDLRYKKNEDKFGNEHIERVQRRNKKGEYITQDLYSAVLIGNKYIKEYGLAKNVVREKGNNTIPQIPITVFTHNTILGDLLPPISSITQHQDNMDFYRFKIMEMVSRDSGKNYVINGSKLEGTTSKTLISDFKSMGIHVTVGATGESDDPTDVKRLVDAVDLTLDSNVMSYLQLYQNEEILMERIMSTNQTDMGQQVSYISKGVQQQTIAQSNQGVIDLFQNYTNFNSIALQHAVELAKLVYTIDGENSKLFEIGDRGAAFLKITKEFRFQDFQIYINVNDRVDEAMKETLKTMAQAWSQNPEYGLHPMDIIKLFGATTLSEMEAIAQSAFRRNEMMKQQAMMQQQQMAMMQQQQALQSQENQTAVREGAANTRAEMQADAKRDVAEMAQMNNPTEAL